MIAAPLLIVSVLSPVFVGGGVVQVHPDLKIGSNPLGVVEGVREDGELRIKRTNNGPTNGYCRVKLFGVVFPKSSAIKRQAIGFLKKRLVKKEVRFKIIKRDREKFSALVLATDLKPGSAANVTWSTWDSRTRTIRRCISSNPPYGTPRRTSSVFGERSEVPARDSAKDPRDQDGPARRSYAIKSFTTKPCTSVRRKSRAE
jgi:hypothetical protein